MTQTGTDQTMNTDEQVMTPDQSEPVVDWEKRYKDLQSHHDKVRVQLSQENETLKKVSTVFTPPKTPEELAAFKMENPDWMGVIETVAHDIASNSIQPIQDKLRETQEREAVATILSAHPDFPQIVETPDFNQWVDEQGPEIQAWLSETQDASKVIRAINYYKAMRPQAPVASPQYQPSAAHAVSTQDSVGNPGNPKARSFSRREIANMHPNEYEKNQEAIMKASRLGLITN
jgi:hypothetical protein